MIDVFRICTASHLSPLMNLKPVPGMPVLDWRRFFNPALDTALLAVSKPFTHEPVVPVVGAMRRVAPPVHVEVDVHVYLDGSGDDGATGE